LSIAAAGLALALDAAFGEPPARLHPVVWMGHLLDWLAARAPDGRWTRFAYGAGVAALGTLGWGVAGWTLERWLPWPLQALALKPTFAGRSLLDSGRRVELALRQGNLPLARQWLRWLVSRPTAELDPELVAAAAIESLAENFVDAWFAPLLAYACFGLGGAYAYRAANTADAMWGYRTPELEWLGKAPARLDDALNWLPARLGAGVLAGVAGPRAGLAGLKIWTRDAGLTASPNAGQPMAVAAGALGVRLEKAGHYVLNTDAPPPGVCELTRARRLIRRAVQVSAGLLLLVLQVRPGRR
jgi:adenosylcobinamide-phosphate synthase